MSPPGPNGRPARVWANGRVGLAMSRSIGDGLCKKYGVIPYAASREALEPTSRPRSLQPRPFSARASLLRL